MRDAATLRYKLFLYYKNFIQKQEKKQKINVFLEIFIKRLGNE